MITNFEAITHELNHVELEMVRPISSSMIRRVGSKNAITAKEITRLMKSAGYRMSPARLRKIIHFIRIQNIVPRLMATSKGYYVCNDSEEYETYLKSLQERVNSINEVLIAMSKQRIEE